MHPLVTEGITKFIEQFIMFYLFLEQIQLTLTVAAATVRVLQSNPSIFLLTQSYDLGSFLKALFFER